MRKVKSSVYSRRYFLSSCDGYDFWEKSFGKQLPPRLAYSLKIVPLKQGEKILDFGCGRGEMVIQSALAGCETVGVDYSKEAINLCREAVKKLKLEKKAKVFIYKNHLSFKDNFFDRVFFLDVAEHLNPDELNKILKEIKRVLKPKGKIIIHTSPNKEWLNTGYRYFTRWVNYLASKAVWEPFFKTKLNYQKDFRSKWEAEVHINEQTTGSLKESLSRAGFTKKKVWLDSRFRITGRGFWFQYVFLQPIWLPFLGRYFTSDIWAVAEKD